MTHAAEIADALADARSETGITATYLRGTTEIALTEVVRGTKVFRFHDEHGSAKHIETSDFLIETAQLAISGSPIEPRIGDKIQETVGDQVFTYQVASINNEPCFTSRDPGKTQIRIHTQKNKTEQA